MKSIIKHWLTFNMKIVVLMVVAVAVVTLYDFFFNIQWIQLLVERNITIVPAVIGLMLQSNYYNLFFKRRVLKIVTPMSLIIKRMASNNNFISFVVKKFKAAFTFINLTVKRKFSISIVKINLVPFTIVPIYFVLAKFNTQYHPRIMLPAFLSLTILTASFDNSMFARELMYVATLLNCTKGVIHGIWIKHYDEVVISMIGIFILIFCFRLLHDLSCHEIVYISVALSIVIFTHNLVLSFVEIPHFVSQLLYNLINLAYMYLLTYSLYYFCMYIIRPIWSLLLYIQSLS